MGTPETTGADTAPVRPEGSSTGTAPRSTSGPSLTQADLDKRLIDCPRETFLALQQFSALAKLWWDQFQAAYIEYGPGAADETGLAGQWGDLHRKVKKLKRFMWEGDAAHLTRETPEEILIDLIGHCFLALEMLGRGSTGGRSSSRSAASSSSSQVSSPSVRASSLPAVDICRVSWCKDFGQGVAIPHDHRKGAYR